MSELHCSNDISSKGALRDLISKYFDLAEIQILSTTLGIDYDDIPGGARKSLKIEGLIDYMRRRGRLDDLLQQLQLERPKVEWPVTSMPSTEEEVVRLLDTYSSKHTQSKIEFGLRVPSEKHAHESWPVKVTEGWQLPKPWWWRMAARSASVPPSPTGQPSGSPCPSTPYPNPQHKNITALGAGYAATCAVNWAITRRRRLSASSAMGASAGFSTMPSICSGSTALTVDVSSPLS